MKKKEFTLDSILEQAAGFSEQIDRLQATQSSLNQTKSDLTLKEKALEKEIFYLAKSLNSFQQDTISKLAILYKKISEENKKYEKKLTSLSDELAKAENPDTKETMKISIPQIQEMSDSNVVDKIIQDKQQKGKKPKTSVIAIDSVEPKPKQEVAEFDVSLPKEPKPAPKPKKKPKKEAIIDLDDVHEETNLITDVDTFLPKEPIQAKSEKKSPEKPVEVEAQKGEEIFLFDL